MKSFRLGTIRWDGTVEPASPLAAEILAAVAAGDDSRQRQLLILVAHLDDGQKQEFCFKTDRRHGRCRDG